LLHPYSHRIKYAYIVYVYGTVEDIFSDRVITRWNQLDQGAVDATSINAFKSKLEGLRYTRMGFFMDQSAYIGNSSSSNRVISEWNALSGEITDSSSLCF